MTQSKVLARLLCAVGAAIVALALVAPTALAKTPAPGFEQFAGCPSQEENSAVTGCFRSVISGGHFQMGNKDVPITQPMTLSGGYTEVGPAGEFFANSKGGLTPVKQLVPGGIIGLTGLDWLVNFLNLEGLKLYAVTELAGKPGPLVFGGNFTLPIKVHLINPVLGNNCYVGSNSNPINLSLTNFTTNPPPPNKPISGKFPEISVAENIFYFKNGVLVDNSFAAPGASGCVLTLFGFIPISINGLVNTQSGLPSPAGTNETVQNTNIELAESQFVYP